MTKCEEFVLQETSSTGNTSGDGIDLSLLTDSLSMTPWERMQANDDAINFAESLREAMEKRNAKLK